MRRFAHLLLLLSALSLVGMPLGWAARTIAVVCANSTETSAPASAFEEEEPTEVAALSRHQVAVRRSFLRRDERVALVSAMLERHRTAYDASLAARRWALYQAPPRAPPHRMLN